MNNDITFLKIEWRTRYSLTNFEDHFGLHTSVIFSTQYVLFPSREYWCDPKLYWSIGRTNCLYYSIRVDLYSHQILLGCVLILLSIYVWTANERNYMRTGSTLAQVMACSLLVGIKVTPLVDESVEVLIECPGTDFTNGLWAHCWNHEKIKYALMLSLMLYIYVIRPRIFHMPEQFCKIMT